MSAVIPGNKYLRDLQKPGLLQYRKTSIYGTFRNQACCNTGKQVPTEPTERIFPYLLQVYHCLHDSVVVSGNHLKGIPCFFKAEVIGLHLVRLQHAR